MSRQAKMIDFHIGSLAVLSMALITLPSRAVAESDRATSHLSRGLDLLSHNRDREALEEFRRAYELSPSPKALAQIGLAEASLGLWMEADKHLSEVLMSTEDKWVAHNLEPIQEQRERVQSHLGWLIVTGTPNAVVSIDGRNHGILPLSSRLIRHAEGLATIDGHLDGHQPLRRSVEVVGGKSHPIALDFPVLAVPVVQQPPPPVPRPASPAAPAPYEEMPVGFKILPWIGFAAGAISLADGIIIYRATSELGVSAYPICLGTFGLGIGLEAFIFTFAYPDRRSTAKGLLVFTTAMGAVGTIVGGAALGKNKGYGSSSNSALGGMSIAAGITAFALDMVILFERSPSGPSIAIAPTPGGLVLSGRF